MTDSIHPREPTAADVLPAVQSALERVLAVEVADPTQDIIAADLLDSLSLFGWVAEVEREFEIDLSLGRLVTDDFRTTARFAEVVSSAMRRKTGEA